MNGIIKSMPDVLNLALKLLLFISIISSAFSSQWHLLSANLLLLILLFIPQFIKNYEKVETPVEFKILLLIFVVSTFFFRDERGMIIQIFFGVAVSFIGFLITLILYHNNQLKIEPRFISLFSICFALSVGVVVEWSKYLLKLFLNSPTNLSSYYFAMENITFIGLGALITALLGFLYMRGKLSIFKKIIQRFKSTNPNIFKSKKCDEILELIQKGENSQVEFKSTLRINLHTGVADKKLESSVLKSMSAFLNSEGGVLIIGVNDQKEIIGVEKDNFESVDKMLLHLSNLINNNFGREVHALVSFNTHEINGVHIVAIECRKGLSPVFLKFDGIEKFFIRAGPSSVEIHGSEMINYFSKRFDN